ncbi:hypothetical protein O7627_21295 [Solwaraspora sp. WMMD1047]|uniref:WXG100-like domain-containing protein n=1 Tax=Solwaraspora sp. WMMD1047 TaxID=3016102 RepID=UPI002417249F|nr:hypothetical protein [Solwaraspora sp. WMMD1047]MDG4831819.1 hypothetical protein [Solwaraspora sp. WMMD1047]
MGIPEPTGSLWAAVKAVYDPWPADDEVDAAEVAGAWRTGGTVLGEGANRAGQAGDASLAAWPDLAGEEFHGRVGTFAADTGRLQQYVANRAAHAEYYGAELTAVKNAIINTIAQNENTWLNDPQLAAGGPAARTAFATQIATSLQAMVAERAAALRAYPVDSPGAAPLAAGQEPPPIRRGLTPAEIAIARRVFGDSLDLSLIMVTDDGLLADLDDRARATPGWVTFPAGTLSQDTNNLNFQHWLIHELTHQWQYQHGANILNLLPHAIVGNYDYGGPAGLAQAAAEGRGFLSFNYEQQGDIVADYYALSRRGELPADSPYLQYVNYVRSVPPGEQVIYGFPPG